MMYISDHLSLGCMEIPTISASRCSLKSQFESATSDLMMFNVGMWLYSQPPLKQMEGSK